MDSLFMETSSLALVLNAINTNMTLSMTLFIVSLALGIFGIKSFALIVTSMFNMKYIRRRYGTTRTKFIIAAVIAMIIQISLCRLFYSESVTIQDNSCGMARGYLNYHSDENNSIEDDRANRLATLQELVKGVETFYKEKCNG